MSDATGSGFSPFMPGFEMLQSLAGQATSGVAQAVASSAPQIPNLSHWVAPTFDVEELDKRIQELKAVHFWLDQNCKALAASVQALEVQKMTLTTLKNMNVSFGEVAQALKMPADGPTVYASPAAAPGSKPSAFAGLEVPPRTYGTAPVAPPVESAPSEAVQNPTGEAVDGGQSAEPTASAPAADPLLWWSALAQQFQQIASHALTDAAQRSVATSGPGSSDQPAARDVAGASQAVSETGPGGSVSRRATAKSRVSAKSKGPTGPAGSSRAGRSSPTRRASAASTQPSTAAPRPTKARKVASEADQTTQPLSPGNWALPSALFPLAGLQAAADAAAASLQPASVAAPPQRASGTARKAAPIKKGQSSASKTAAARRR